MKKGLLFAITMCAVAVKAGAQGIELTVNGEYEKKEVVTVDSVSASVLYDRAMEALSDWNGSDGRSKAGLDYHERDAGTVIYKGSYFIDGNKRMYVTANFTLKVRCKDGRAQVTVTIPSITAKAIKVTMEKTVTLADAVKNPKRGAYEYLPKIPIATINLIAAMRDKLRTAVDDDF